MAYYTYILTNYNKTVLYTGVTNDLQQRLAEHYFGNGRVSSFTTKYKAYYLIYYEVFKYVEDAISREKEIKGFTRKKKEQIINRYNPQWDFLNNRFHKIWPPKDHQCRMK